MTDTPMTDEVRRAYVYVRVTDGLGEPRPVAEEEFTVWLANVQADALMEARHLVIGTPGFHLLTERATEIRGNRS